MDKLSFELFGIALRPGPGLGPEMSAVVVYAASIRELGFMKKFALALLAGVAFAPVAHAADLAARTSPMYTKAPAAVQQVGNWTGFYIGGNVGGAFGHYDAANNGVTDVLSDGTVTAPDNLDGASGHGNGVTAGGTIGYNWQIQQWVLGVEGDFNYVDSKYSVGATTTTTAPSPLLTNTQSAYAKTDWFSTIRGRLGYSFGNTLLYATGGLALADVEVGASEGTTDAAGASVFSVSGSQSKVLAGYAVGAGAEVQVGGGWSVKAEYLHMGFGRQGFDVSGQVTQPAPPAGTTSVATESLHSDVKADFDVVRAGVNYKF